MNDAMTHGIFVFWEKHCVESSRFSTEESEAFSHGLMLGWNMAKMTEGMDLEEAKEKIDFSNKSGDEDKE